MERIEEWLGQGGHVLASTQRAARRIAAAYHAARQKEGRTAWPTPMIFAWDEWVRDRWLEQNRAGLMLLNPLQEQMLWTRVIRNRPAIEGLQHLDRLAQSAQSAYSLLARYSPETLEAKGRLSWTGDAAIFSGWLADLDERCRREGLVSACRLPLLLTDALWQNPTPESGTSGIRPPLLLAGFDRLLSSQKALLDAWGRWQEDFASEEAAGPATNAQFFVVQDEAQEVEACTRWLRAKLRSNHGVRLMVVTTNLQSRRGELERAMLDAAQASEEDDVDLDFEFSLGQPLAAVGAVRSALLMMRWLVEPLSESEVDWLLTSGYCAANAEEEIALAETMLAMRGRGWERPQWSFEAFCIPGLPSLTPPAAWVTRLSAARRSLELSPGQQSPLEWVRFAEQMLESVGWPGFRPQSSVVFQALKRWRQVLEECGSLGYDGSQMEWSDFVGTVTRAVSDTIFSLESSDAPVQITEPLPAAGLVAEGIWFLGASAEAWPGRGQPNPLLPVALQRDSSMPHSSHKSDWELANAVTGRLFRSTNEVIFSYAQQSGGVETRPSRLLEQRIGKPHPLPTEWTETPQDSNRRPLTEVFADTSRIPFPTDLVAGGSETLTRQSLCPFQAFATARLNAQDWEPAETGLNAKQRGQLLHSVLHQVWGGKAHGGISTLVELQKIAQQRDIRNFVQRVVNAVMREQFTPGRRGSMPARFPARLLELEAERLTQLVSEWLEYELQRQPFHVIDTERKAEVNIGGLRLRLRLDRVDRVGDGLQLVIDYKSSDLGPSAWRGPRPDDVQLPLYATFAVQGRLEGLLIAQVRRNEMKFCGRVQNAATSLLPGLSGNNGLVKDPLNETQMDEWRRLIEQLALDFLAGNAQVAPKDPARTCERCCLHAVCRINENQPLAALLGDSDGDSTREDENGLGERDA